MKARLGMAAALHLGLLVLYYPTLSFRPLALDDQRQLAHAASDAWRLLGPDPFGHARPVKQLLFQVAAKAALEPGVLRAAILGLLLGCVALVQVHATRVSGSARLGLAVAACFGTNPALASVAAWLSGVNVLVATALVVAYLEVGERAVDRGGWRLAAALALLVLAMLSYEIAVVAPIVLAVRLWVRGASTPTATPTPTRRRAIWIGSALCAVAVIALRVAAGAAPPAYRSAEGSPLLLSASAARYLLENAALWLLPWNRFGVLLTDEPSRHLLASAVSVVAVLGAFALAYRLRARDRVFTYGLASFALFMLPLSNLIPFGHTPVAMHYLCLPSIGLALALCRGSSRFLARAPTAVPAALLVALCLAFAAAARPAIAAFGDERLLYSRTIEHHPDNLEALVNLASVELSRGDFERAAAPLDRAQRIAPHDPGVVRNRFVLLFQTRRLPEALALLEAQPALDRDPGMLTGRGEVLAHLGRFDEAAASFERAYELAPPGSDDRLTAGYQLLVLYLSQRAMDRVRPLFSNLLSEYPDSKELARARALLAGPPP